MIDRQLNRNVNSEFFRDTYLHSGWIPMYPFGQMINSGDVFQIQNGQLLSLFNIAQLDLTRPEVIRGDLPLREQDWPHTSGCLQINNNVYDEVTESGGTRYRQQHYRFERPGAYLFSGRNPSGQFMMNWHHLSEELIVKLTQSKFTFQEVYVVTATAQIPQWGLAIADRSDAELRLSAQTESEYCLFLSESCRITDSSYMSVYEHSHTRPLYFFQAKKLILSDQKYDHYLRELLLKEEDMSMHYTKNWLQSSLLNLATSNELNISTCMDFFQWQDANLDDVVRLCANRSW